MAFPVVLVMTTKTLSLVCDVPAVLKTRKPSEDSVVAKPPLPVAFSVRMPPMRLLARNVPSVATNQSTKTSHR